jgi:hypothetical protein
VEGKCRFFVGASAWILFEEVQYMLTRNAAGAAVLALSACFAAAAQPQCTMANVVGLWAHAVSGLSIPKGATAPVETVFIGVLNIDWSGKVTGTGTTASAAPSGGGAFPAGQMLEFDYVKGSIQLTPDCTGLLATYIQLKGAPIPPIGPYTGRFIAIPDKNEMIAMSGLAPDGKPMWTYTLRRMSHVPGPVAWLPLQ